MIIGPRITLRTWHDGDVPSLIVLRNNIKLQAQLLSRVRGSSVDQVKRWLSDNHERIVLIISESFSGDVLGFIQISNIESIDCHGELGICLIEKAQGRGFGKEAITMFMSYLRDIWGLKKVVVKVRDDNVIAKSCYESIGFVNCGKMKSHFFIEGCWHDIVIMEYLFK